MVKKNLPTPPIERVHELFLYHFHTLYYYIHTQCAYLFS